MMPAHAATQKVAAGGDVEVVERVLGAALADDEGDDGGDRDRREAERERPLSGTGAKLIARMSAPTSSDREDAAEVVDRLGRLVHVGRDEEHGQHQRDGRERQRHEEHRAPPEVLEQHAGDQRAERGDRAAQSPTTARSTGCAPGPTTAR